MYICIVKIKLHLYSPQSLKEKRSIIKSVTEKTRHKFHIAIAEVGDQELWQSSILGLSMVSNDKIKLEKIMTRITDYIENNIEGDIISIQHEIWSF